jgi:hypothetical protein
MEGDRCVLLQLLFQHPPDETEGLKKLKFIGYSTEIQTGPTYEYMSKALRTHQCASSNGDQKDVIKALE